MNFLKELYPAPWRWSGKILWFQKFTELSSTLTLTGSGKRWDQVAPIVHFKDGIPQSWQGRPMVSPLRSEDECVKEDGPNPWKLPGFNLTNLEVIKMGSAKPQSYRIFKKKGSTDKYGWEMLHYITSSWRFTKIIAYKRIWEVIRHSALSESP